MQVVCEVDGLGGLGRLIQWSKINGDIPDGIVADRGTLRYIIKTFTNRHWCRQLDRYHDIFLGARSLHIQIEFLLPRSESLPANGAGVYRCTVETRTNQWYQDFFLNLGGQP